MDQTNDVKDNVKGDRVGCHKMMTPSKVLPMPQ